MYLGRHGAHHAQEQGRLTTKQPSNQATKQPSNQSVEQITSKESRFVACAYGAAAIQIEGRLSRKYVSTPKHPESRAQSSMSTTRVGLMRRCCPNTSTSNGTSMFPAIPMPLPANPTRPIASSENLVDSRDKEGTRKGGEIRTKKVAVTGHCNHIR